MLGWQCPPFNLSWAVPTLPLKASRASGLRGWSQDGPRGRAAVDGALGQSAGNGVAE